jgi:hypothetical protein
MNINFEPYVDMIIHPASTTHKRSTTLYKAKRSFTWWHILQPKSFQIAGTDFRENIRYTQGITGIVIV